MCIEEEEEKKKEMTRSVHPFSLLDSSLLIIITRSISSQPIASFEISRRIKEGCKKMRNELGLIARFFHPSRRITFSFIPRCVTSRETVDDAGYTTRSWCTHARFIISPRQSDPELVTIMVYYLRIQALLRSSWQRR